MRSWSVNKCRCRTWLAMTAKSDAENNGAEVLPSGASELQNFEMTRHVRHSRL